MGRDKALLPLEGGTVLDHIVQQAGEAAPRVVLVGGANPHRVTGASLLSDAFPGDGPLGGILTSLRHSSARWNLITACDMPGMTAAFLDHLFNTAERSGAQATVPVTAGSGRHPLCAVYRLDALAPLERAWASGERSVLRAIASLDVCWQPAADPDVLQNVNTPAEWDAFVAGRRP